MDWSLFIIFLFYGGLGIAIVYLIIRRIRIMKSDDFEDRDN